MAGVMTSFLGNLPVVISYYTVNTPYEEEVKHLIASCKKFGLDTCIEGIPSQGSWEKNCAIKPFFIKEKLHALQRPVFWVDADAVFLKEPSFSLFLPYDFSVTQAKVEDVRFQYNAASIFVNSTSGGFEAVDRWCKATAYALKEFTKIPPFLDQVTLLYSFQKVPNILFLSMPKSYCKIFDLDKAFVPQEEVVIEQNQASRRLKSFFEKS